MPQFRYSIKVYYIIITRANFCIIVSRVKFVVRCNSKLLAKVFALTDSHKLNIYSKCKFAILMQRFVYNVTTAPYSDRDMKIDIKRRLLLLFILTITKTIFAVIKKNKMILVAKMAHKELVNCFRCKKFALTITNNFWRQLAVYSYV